MLYFLHVCVRNKNLSIRACGVTRSFSSSEPNAKQLVILLFLLVLPSSLSWTSPCHLNAFEPLLFRWFNIFEARTRERHLVDTKKEHFWSESLQKPMFVAKENAQTGLHFWKALWQDEMDSCSVQNWLLLKPYFTLAQNFLLCHSSDTDKTSMVDRVPFRTTKMTWENQLHSNNFCNANTDEQCKHGPHPCLCAGQFFPLQFRTKKTGNEDQKEAVTYVQCTCVSWKSCTAVQLQA